MKQKAMFIIPGYRHKPNNKAYREIAKVLKKEGYQTIPVNIRWRKTTISENSEYFLKKYKKIYSKKKYILGFSFGAMIAFIASTKVNPSGLILCSLSPYFKEDLSKSKDWTTALTEARYQDFLNLHCSVLTKQIKAKQIHMLYGAKEAKSLIKRVTETFDEISSPNKFLISIKKTEHNIGDKRYLNIIHQVAKHLNDTLHT